MHNEPSSSYKDPNWWTTDHSSGWERAKAAVKRDWEQTKADVSSGGHELNQQVGDTVKQATGKEPIPAPGVPNPGKARWEDAEPGLRFGYGARRYHGGGEWNDGLESQLSKDWQASNGEGTWARVKDAVREGWDAAKKAVSH